MNRLNNSLCHLVDSIDVNSRYNLCHTDECRDRIINALDLHTNTPTHNTVPEQTVLMVTTSSSTTTTTTTQPTCNTHVHCSSLYNITSRFCGNVPLGTPNRVKLVSYDVNRWLADTNTRIAAKGITDPQLMIREAKLAVNPDVGDATRVLNTGRMCNIQDFNVFKDKCLCLWRPPEEKDRYLALQQFLSVRRTETVGSYINDIEKSRTDIISDLQSDRNFMMGTAQEWLNSDRSDVLV